MERVLYRTALVLLLLALLPGAYAAVFSVDVQAVVNEIQRNESASYTVTVSNFQTEALQFQVYTIDPAWNVRTDPVTPSVPAGAQGEFSLYLRPTASAEAKTQGVSITFKDLISGALVRKDVVLSLRGLGVPARGYEPTVALEVLMPYEIDPRHPVPLRLELRNRNALNISNLTIFVSSPHFSSTTYATLPPLSEKTIDVVGLSVDPLSDPVEEDLLIQLRYQGEVVNQLVKNYRIKEYTAVHQDVDEEAFFFKTSKTVRVQNEGNVKNTALVTVPTSLLKSLFVSSDLPYERATHEGERVLLWSIPLAPDEVRTFTYTENYRILILLILLVALGGVAYLLLRSPIVVVKEAVGIAKGDGVSHIKIRIFVKNRSARIIQSIQVTDRLPSLADVVNADAPGSLSPAKVAVSDKQGTLLRWDLEVLEPYEERVLTYQARSKLKIIGRMSLPKAKVRFTGGGKEHVVYSDNVEIVERFKDR